MGIEYLLFLQNIRDSVSTLVPEAMLDISSFFISVWPMILAGFVYWAFDRKAGKQILGALAIALFLNGLLKCTFCIYRPWILDSRIIPYGDSMVSATGYSFPSAHATYSTALIGGIGLWLWDKNRKLSIVCLVCILLVMLSRNMLGVHTLLDVIVGVCLGLFSLFLSRKIEEWTDQDPSRDKTAAIIAVVLSIAAGFYFVLKPYPLDYDAAGKLLADPVKMSYNSFEGCGTLTVFYVSRCFERNGYDFDHLMSWKDSFITGALLVPFIVFWKNGLSGIIMGWNPYIGKILEYSMVLFLIMIGGQWAMKKTSESGLLTKNYR